MWTGALLRRATLTLRGRASYARRRCAGLRRSQHPSGITLKISAQFSFWAAVVFAAVCGAYALYGLSTLDADVSGQQRSDTVGFALFWLFLAAVGVAMAIVSRLILRGRIGKSGE